MRGRGSVPCGGVDGKVKWIAVNGDRLRKQSGTCLSGCHWQRLCFRFSLAAITILLLLLLLLFGTWQSVRERRQQSIWVECEKENLYNTLKYENHFIKLNFFSLRADFCTSVYEYQFVSSANVKNKFFVFIFPSPPKAKFIKEY